MYSTKNTLKVMVSPFTAHSNQTILSDLQVGEIGFFDAVGAIAATGAGYFYWKKSDGKVLKSVLIANFAGWAGVESYVAPVMQAQTVSISDATAGELYQLRLEMKIPYMQGEYIKHGNYKAITGDSVTTIAAALVVSINAAMTREEKDYYTITSSVGVITILQKLQPYVKAKKQGRPIAFNSGLTHPQDIAVLGAVSIPGSDGIGYGPYIAEKEMLAQGDSDSFRFNTWPNSFDWDALETSVTGEYDVLVVSEDGAIKTAMDLVTANQDYLICFDSAGSAPIADIT